MKLLSGEENGFGDKILCPKCPQEYVHTAGEVVKLKSDDYSAWDGRGSALRIPMECESGHKWYIRLGFHKGETYIANEVMSYKIIP